MFSFSFAYIISIVQIIIMYPLFIYNKFKTTTRVKPWVKIPKLCLNQSPFPREKEGSLTAKSPNLSSKNMVQLNHTHSLLNLQAKFFKILYFGQIPVNYANSTQFTHHSPRITQNSHHLLTFYTLCFRHLPQQRTLRNSSELHKFHAPHPHSPQTT